MFPTLEWYAKLFVENLARDKTLAQPINLLDGYQVF